MVTWKIGALGKHCSLEADQIDRIIWALFLRTPYGWWQQRESRPFFSVKKMEVTVLFMKNKKASGTNVIPAEVYKPVLQQRPDLPLTATLACLISGESKVRFVNNFIWIQERCRQHCQFWGVLVGGTVLSNMFGFFLLQRKYRSTSEVTGWQKVS